MGFVISAVIIVFSISETRLYIIEALKSANPFDEGNSGRFDNMLAAVNVWIRNPWGVGYGIGNATVKFDTSNVAATYNDMLKTLLELGIPGLACYLIIYVTPLYRVSNCGLGEDSNYKYIVVMVVCVLLEKFLSEGNWPTFYACLALSLVTTNRLKNNITKIRC